MVIVPTYSHRQGFCVMVIFTAIGVLVVAAGVVAGVLAAAVAIVDRRRLGLVEAEAFNTLRREVLGRLDKIEKRLAPPSQSGAPVEGGKSS